MNDIVLVIIKVPEAKAMSLLRVPNNFTSMHLKLLLYIG